MHDREQPLKSKRKQVKNTAEEQTDIVTVVQVIHRTLENSFANQRCFTFSNGATWHIGSK